MPIITEDVSYRDRLEDGGWDVDANGCWIWGGQYERRRAKVATIFGNINSAKAMWVHFYGEVPHPELEVCHACHNSACVNINHLYLANHVRNMQDMGEAAPLLPHANTRPGKPGRPRAINDDDRGRLPYLVRSRLLTNRELAKLFDVSESTVRAAIKETCPS